MIASITGSIIGAITVILVCTFAAIWFDMLASFAMTTNVGKAPALFTPIQGTFSSTTQSLSTEGAGIRRTNPANTNTAVVTINFSASAKGVIGKCTSSTILGRLVAALFWLELAVGSFETLIGSNIDRTRGAHSNGSSDLVILLKRSCHGRKVLPQGHVQQFGLHTAAFVLEQHRNSFSIVRSRLLNQFLHKAFNRFHWQSLVGKKSPKVTGVANIAHGTFLSLQL